MQVGKQLIYTVSSPVGGVPKAGDAGCTASAEFMVPADGTLELFVYRIYLGAQNTLKLWPQIIRRGDLVEDIVHYTGKGWLDGDDDSLPFAVNIPVFHRDIIRVYWDNTDAVNVHNFRCFFTIDHLGGVYRAQLLPKGVV